MMKKTNEKESLSALLDGELGRADELELRRLSKACGEDAELLAIYERYTLVKTVLSGETVTQNSLFNKVSAAIADEAALVNAAETQVNIKSEKVGELTRLRQPAILKLAGQWAVAASVAVLVVSIAQWSGHNDSHNSQLASVEGSAPVESLFTVKRPLPRNVVTVSAGEDLSTSISAAQLQGQRRARMQKYLMYHLEHASLNDSRGMMPFARVSYFEGEY